MATVYNTTDSPVPIDKDGHTLGGYEHADVKDNDEVKAALAYGSLVEIESAESASRRKPKES